VGVSETASKAASLSDMDDSAATNLALAVEQPPSYGYMHARRVILHPLDTFQACQPQQFWLW
jgi:hypothetical protein